MPFSATDVLYGFVAPAIAAFVAYFLLRSVFAADVADRYATGLAFAVAVFVGNWLLALSPWHPTSSWHWLPYAVALAAIIGGAVEASGLRTVERIAIYAVIAIVAAWHLAPTRANLDPARGIQIATWAALVAVVATAIAPLPRFIGPALLNAVLAFVCGFGAIVMIFSGSLRFAQLAGLGVGGMAGLAVAHVFPARPIARDAVALPLAVFLCGAMWIGYVNSFTSVPLASYLLVAISPLAMWIARLGPIAQLTGFKRVAVIAVAGIALAALGSVLAYLAEPDLTH
jgi:hypothetical protein